MGDTLTGLVGGLVGTNTMVTCPDAPSHLRTLYLTPSQLGNARTGDIVELTYYSTPTSGYWAVSGFVKRVPRES